MDEQTVSVADIAIIGLGEVGGRFLAELLKRKQRGLNVVCVAQHSNTPGRQLAEEEGIPILTLSDIIDKGNEIDVIFDLTGNPEVRRHLRERLRGSDNRHTTIAPESIARVLWSVMSEEELSNWHAASGY